MRKILTILIILPLFMSQVGYYFIYTIRQYQLKEQMKEALLRTIPESLLEIVVADENHDSIIWEEDGKEFSLDGQLYDVAKIKKVNGKTLLYCLKDKKEQQLLDDFSKAAKAGNDKRGKQTIKFQLTDPIPDNNERVPTTNRASSQKYVGFTAALRSFIIEITVPPPRV